jgi:hypothetical protein
LTDVCWARLVVRDYGKIYENQLEKIILCLFWSLDWVGMELVFWSCLATRLSLHILIGSWGYRLVNDNFLSIRSIDNRYRYRIVIVSLSIDPIDKLITKQSPLTTPGRGPEEARQRPDRSLDESPDRGPTKARTEAWTETRRVRVARLISKVPGVVGVNKQNAKLYRQIIEYRIEPYRLIDNQPVGLQCVHFFSERFLGLTA